MPRIGQFDKSTVRVTKLVQALSQTYLHLAVFGDSRHASAVTGNKLLKTDGHWVVRALQLSGNAGRIYVYAGVSAERTDQFEDQFQDLLKNGNVKTAFMKGGVNNITQAPYTHAQSGATVTFAQSGAAAAADMISYVERATAAGIEVYLEEDEGIDATWPAATWTAAMSTQLGIMNSILESYCKHKSGATFVKFSDVVFDRTSATNKHVALVKYDGTHDSSGGSLIKAQSALKNYPNMFPQVAWSVNPATSAYSGDPTTPIQILDNPGFANVSGGTLGAGAAAFTAWAQGTNFAAKSFCTNAGKLYYSVAGGIAGATAPTHTNGTVSDGTVQWLYIMSSTNSIPALWGIKVANGATYAVGTAVNDKAGVDVIVVALFTQANSTVTFYSGSDLNINFRGRQLVGKKYSLKGNVQIIDHTNLAATTLRWDRGDLTNVPSDGYSNATYWTDQQARFTNTLGSYPIRKFLCTDPYDAESGTTPGTVVAWNNFGVQIVGAGAGFAITRISDCAMTLED